MSLAPRPAPLPASEVPVVFVAEDDDEMRTLVTRALRRDAYEVLAARDGASLLAAIRAARFRGREPDIIVSDVRMPNLGGLELVRLLAAEGSRARVVLISAFADESLLLSTRELGVAHVLSKPFDMDDLRTVIMVLLGRRP